MTAPGYLSSSGTMRTVAMAFALCCLSCLHARAQQSTPEARLLALVDDFFAALEKQDTAMFRNMFVDRGYIYSVREVTADSVLVRSQSPRDFRFRPGQVLKERMRRQSTSVSIDGRIAMVWAPYDLWVNDTFSHCGVDVFTFLQTSKGWKIASIAYTLETTDCK
jgi:hypothetical protein